MPAHLRFIVLWRLAAADSAGAASGGRRTNQRAMRMSQMWPFGGVNALMHAVSVCVELLPEWNTNHAKWFVEGCKWMMGDKMVYYMVVQALEMDASDEEREAMSANWRLMGLSEQLQVAKLVYEEAAKERDDWRDVMHDARRRLLASPK